MGTGRYTLLRWAVNQDDDVWLSMRGTRHQQKCGTCGLPGESFPHGYYQPRSVNPAFVQSNSMHGLSHRGVSLSVMLTLPKTVKTNWPIGPKSGMFSLLTL